MSFHPKCPNHTVQMDPTDNPRIWICPVSSARFECDVDQAATDVKFDKYGKPIQNYKIKAIDEE